MHTETYGCVKSPNLNMRFLFQNRPYDVKIGKLIENYDCNSENLHRIRFLLFGDLFYTLKACLYGYLNIEN